MLKRIRENLIRQIDIVDKHAKSDLPEKLGSKCREFVKRLTGK